MRARNLYPVELDENAGLPLVVTIKAVRHPGAVGQHGAVELAGALGIVPDLRRDGWRQTASESESTPDRLRGTDGQPHLSAVLLDEVLVRGTVVVGLNLVAVIVGCTEMEKQSVSRTDRQVGKPGSQSKTRWRGVLRDRKVLRF